MRVLIAPIEVSGFYRALNAGFQELGVDSIFAELWPHPFQYASSDADYAPPISWARSLARRQRSAPRRSLRRAFWLMVGGFVRLFIFVWSLPRFDVFVFGFGHTIMYAPWLELRVLKALRKKIVFHFHGSDSRPPYLDGYLNASDESGARPDFARLAKATKRRVEVIDRYADIVVDNPLSAHFHTRECINGFAIGIPSVQRTAPSLPPAREGTVSPLRILHAPSHLEAKGTPVIRATIQELLSEGISLEYVEIIGQPNERVLEELARCDFVIDQLYSDTPMAGFAAEAARFGKPAIVCGYALDEFRKWIPPEATPPSYYCHPSDLKIAIARLAMNTEFRNDLGGRARAFFDLRCRPRDVAQRYLAAIKGECPSAWKFDPRCITYLEGCGLSEEKARQRISELVSTHGSPALQLEDKPALKSALVAFGART